MVKKYKIKLYKSPIYKRFESVMKNKRSGCTTIVWCSRFFLLYEKIMQVYCFLFQAGRNVRSSLLPGLKWFKASICHLFRAIFTAKTFFHGSTL